MTMMGKRLSPALLGPTFLVAVFAMLALGCPTRPSIPEIGHCGTVDCGCSVSCGCSSNCRCPAADDCAAVAPECCGIEGCGCGDECACTTDENCGAETGVSLTRASPYVARGFAGLVTEIVTARAIGVQDALFAWSVGYRAAGLTEACVSIDPDTGKLTVAANAAAGLAFAVRATLVVEDEPGEYGEATLTVVHAPAEEVRMSPTSVIAVLGTEHFVDGVFLVQLRAEVAPYPAASQDVRWAVVPHVILTGNIRNRVSRFFEILDTENPPVSIGADGLLTIREDAPGNTDWLVSATTTCRRRK